MWVWSPSDVSVFGLNQYVSMQLQLIWNFTFESERHACVSQIVLMKTPWKVLSIVVLGLFQRGYATVSAKQIFGAWKKHGIFLPFNCGTLLSTVTLCWGAVTGRRVGFVHDASVHCHDVEKSCSCNCKWNFPSCLLVQLAKPHSLSHRLFYWLHDIFSYLSIL